MGRHSRPEGEEGSSGDAATEQVRAASADRPTPQGRHAAADEADEAPRPKPGPGPKRSSGATDLRLIRSHADVRNRCLAAVLVPFIVFTAAMFAIGRADVYLFWVWLPTIVAGVLVGSILDHAHKRYPDG